MTRIMIAVAVLACVTSGASAQSYFGGMGRYHGVMPKPGLYRAVNISPTTGRPYLEEALVNPSVNARGVKANPFMERFTVADLRNWADRKMQVPRL